MGKHKIPWPVIKEAYITRDVKPSFREIAEQYHPGGFALIHRAAKRDGWDAQREQHWKKIRDEVEAKNIKSKVKEISANEAIINVAINSLVAQIRTNELKGTYGDLARLVALRVELTGLKSRETGDEFDKQSTFYREELIRRITIRTGVAKPNP